LGKEIKPEVDIGGGHSAFGASGVEVSAFSRTDDFGAASAFFSGGGFGGRGAAFWLVAF